MNTDSPYTALDVLEMVGKASCSYQDGIHTADYRHVAATIYAVALNDGRATMDASGWYTGKIWNVGKCRAVWHHLQRFAELFGDTIERRETAWSTHWPTGRKSPTAWSVIVHQTKQPEQCSLLIDNGQP